MRILFRPAFLIVLVMSMSLVVACGDDDDDDDDDDDSLGDDDDSNEAANSCEDTVTVLSDVNQQSELVGISGQDLLDVTGGGFTVSATYSEDTSILTQNPAGGQTDLTVTITYDGGDIREVESVPVDDGSGQEIAADCRHRVEMDVTITVSTADGAFDETWEAVLVQTLDAEGTGLELPTFAADFDPYALTGTYEIVSIAGETPDSVTGALYSTAADPYSGSIDIFVEQSSGTGDEGTVSQADHIALDWSGAL